jgi:hypothetical protein
MTPKSYRNADLNPIAESYNEVQRRGLWKTAIEYDGIVDAIGTIFKTI